MRDRHAIAERQLRTLFNFGASAGLTDGQLLDRFRTRSKEEAELAFAVLVERHGPMVLRLCQRILLDPNDAQDAAQATFLVLVRKAGSVRNRDSIASWLYGVAYRVASYSKSTAARRRRHESRYAAMAGELLVEGGSDDEVSAVLREEIDRLPERYRIAVLLCDLEGLTHEQAAEHQGCPAGTIKSRLARGRARLEERLRRRGIAPTFGPFGLLVASQPGFVSSRIFIETTTSVALRAATDYQVAGAIPAAVSSLASGALWMMRLNVLKQWSTAAFLATALTGVSVAAAGMRSDPEPPASPRPTELTTVPALPSVTDPNQTNSPTVFCVVEFIEAPGLSFRKSGIKNEYDIGSPARIAFLSEGEVDLLHKYLKGVPKAIISRAPEVSILSNQHANGDTPPGRSLVVRNSDDLRRPVVIATDVEHRDSDAPADPSPNRRNDFGRNKEIAKGCEVRLSGQPSADGVYQILDVSIRNLHVVEVHTTTTPGQEGGKLEVSEEVRSDIDQRITLPAANGTALISLGLMRTVDATGASSIAERLVMINVRTPAKSNASVVSPNVVLPK